MSDPTPTPREVLARAIHEQWRRDVGIIDPVRWEDLFADERDGLMRQADACLAALAATGDAPLPPRTACPECGEGCPGWIVQEDVYTGDETQRRCRACDEYEQICAAYTTLAAQGAAARAERDALREALERFIDGEECRFDHHGYCQTHTSLEEGPCLMVQARAALATPARPTDTGRVG